jgi:rifampicin phosphotransferase
MIPTHPASTELILPLSSEAATLQAAGGKGANLSRLVRAGFSVPGGFLLTTQAYQVFVAANALEDRIQTALSQVAGGDPPATESASATIRALFKGGRLPVDLADALVSAYIRLGRPAVAVRSSATAEDLPETSFAGQQDTYLNVIGEEALLEAVKACWGSLWTARAINYRAHNAICQEGIALCVVVQVMVESQVSGVMFTANPLTGLRAETVIDATYGLGEALVSGQVEPDHYVVDPTQNNLLKKVIGAKAISIRGKVDGGTTVIQEATYPSQALPDEQILALAKLGQQVAALYQAPQDIEWAWADNRLVLLQSRAITSLFPLPEGMTAEPLKVMFSFGAVQGMLDPITPYGRDVIYQAFAIGSGLFGLKRTADTQTALLTAGERLWANISTLMHNSVGRKLIPAILPFIEPTILQALDKLWDDPRLKPGKTGLSPRAITQIARFILPMAANVILNLLSPAARREAIVHNGENVLDVMAARCSAIQGDRQSRLARLAQMLPELADKYLRRTLILFVSGVAAGMASFNLLFKLSSELPKTQPDGTPARWGDLIMKITRGLPNNPTTEMDLRLWDIAQTIHRDPPSYQVFQANPTETLTTLYQQKQLPGLAQSAIDRFLSQYGGRGLGEIDAGRPRWSENPLQVVEMLANYLHIDKEEQAPDVVFRQSAKSAAVAIDELSAAVSQTRMGWLKARLVRLAAHRARELMGIRESPKFFAVRMFAIPRRALLGVGQEFVQAGELDHPDDLFFLSTNELIAFAKGEKRDWKALIVTRRETFERERRRRQIPRLLLSDGRAFYEGLISTGGDDHTLIGSPVSPGSVQGKVRVVLDPRQAHLIHGEIMVCPGTDPSWTPLFLSAGGLVMETGGMMTHGAVVAREYGIPAIVGVDQATRRLVTGQTIQMDGSTGQIVILDGQDGL